MTNATARNKLGLYFAIVVLGVVLPHSLAKSSVTLKPPDTGTGNIVGKIVLTATPAPNPVIRMGMDPNCLKLNAGKHVTADIVLRSDDGGLANAFVNVSGSFPQAPHGSSTVTLDQQGCMYHPRVLGAQVGDKLVIRNDDSALHNIHSLSPEYSIDVSQPQTGMTYDVPLTTELIVLRLKCNVHPWMAGYVGIANSPYFAVSGDDGKFQISGVPAGKQTIQVWHEVYGSKTASVDVKAGGTAEVTITYAGDEHASAVDPRLREVIITDGVPAARLVPPMPDH
jgi:plastocyanin